MASNNGGGDGCLVFFLLILLGIGGFVVYALVQMAIVVAMGVYAFILYASLFLGVLAIIAAIRGIRFFNLIVSPLHARLFLVRGVFGALLVPSFVWFASWYYGFAVAGWLWPHLAFGGYAMLSTGVFFMGSDGGAGIVEEIIGIEGPPRYREINAPRAALPSRSKAEDAKDFRFATWDDEEELRGR